MCLAVKYRAKHQHGACGMGWKILVRDAKGRYFTGICGAKRVKLNFDTYTDCGDQPHQFIPLSGKRYIRAFHIFVNLEEARLIFNIDQKYGVNKYMLKHGEMLVLCEVLYKAEVAFGETHWKYNSGYYSQTAVARKCKLVARMDV